MTQSEIIRYRLYNQHLVNSRCKSPEEVVSAMVAMQAQDFAMAKWAIGLRAPGTRAVDVETAFDEGKILRTHLMRPTWHFVAPSDIRWMLELTKPRVHAANAYMYRQSELDLRLLRRSANIIAKNLEGNNHQTRDALNQSLAKAKVKAKGFRLGYIMMYAELEGVICSGPRLGKQFTYALLEERVPKARKLNQEEARAEFASRYFATRGPATVHDFAYWSGLTVADARKGVDSLDAKFVREKINGKDNYLIPLPVIPRKRATFLVPDYDEYVMGYNDRSAFDNPPRLSAKEEKNMPFHLIAVDGMMAGTWRSILKGRKAKVETKCVDSLSGPQKQAVKRSVEGFLSFFKK